MLTASLAERLGRINPLEAPNPVISPEAQAFIDTHAAGETDGVSCWRSENVERRAGSSIEGVGLFAAVQIKRGEVIAVKTGHVLGYSGVLSMPDLLNGSQQQIGIGRYLGGKSEEEVAKNLVGYNHSCAPNSYIVVPEDAEHSERPAIFLVALEDIEQQEEITADYSTSESSRAHRIVKCNCGSKNCRGLIDPRYDWQDPRFQQKNWDLMPDYLKEKIQAREARGNQDTPDEAVLRKFDNVLLLAELSNESGTSPGLRNMFGQHGVLKIFNGKDRESFITVYNRLVKLDKESQRLLRELSPKLGLIVTATMGKISEDLESLYGFNINSLKALTIAEIIDAILADSDLQS